MHARTHAHTRTQPEYPICVVSLFLNHWCAVASSCHLWQTFKKRNVTESDETNPNDRKGGKLKKEREKEMEK